MNEVAGLKPSPSLGVVAICYNEERDLPGFLGCLLSWVDEIILIDDGSSDATEKMAKEAGDKVTFIRSPRCEGEYFAEQRNKGIRAAKSDWLLHMDIDERVTVDLANEIQLAIKDVAIDGYRFRRLNYFLHRPMLGGGWQDWNLIHLARRELFHFEGMFHEACIIDAPPHRIGQLKSKMVHLNDTSYHERMRKSLSYSEEQAIHVSARFSKLTWFHFIALPCYEFLRKFFIKKGYKDRTLGLLFAIHSANAMFRACALVWDERNRISREELERMLAAKGK
jgi:(heptosyl)LPS beta-1,4-glucosyltransferase